MAAAHPFGRVIGVELEPALCDLAAVNLERLRHRRRCRSWEIVNVDATTFVVPADVSVVAIFRLFGDRILESILDRLRESMNRDPRRLKVISLSPYHGPEPLESCSWLRLRRGTTIGPDDRVRLRMYEASR